MIVMSRDEIRNRGNRMRIAAGLFAVCLLPSAAESAPGLDVTGYGILANTPTTKVGTGTGGIEQVSSSNDYVLRTTDTIPVCLGTRFGILYRITGEPVGAAVNLVAINKFPAPGLAVPGVAAPVHEDRYGHTSRIGSQGFSWYEFDNQWEMVPGIWTLEIWSGNQRLASHVFNVVRVQNKTCIASPIT